MKTNDGITSSYEGNRYEAFILVDNEQMLEMNSRNVVGGIVFIGYIEFQMSRAKP